MEQTLKLLNTRF